MRWVGLEKLRPGERRRRKNGQFLARDQWERRTIVDGVEIAEVRSLPFLLGDGWPDESTR